MNPRKWKALTQAIYNNFQKSKNKKEMRQSFFESMMCKRPEQSQPTSTPVVITSYSQPHVLQHRMKEEKLTHGQTVTADLSPIRLESNFGKMIMYFCPMQGISIHEQITAGDGGSLPNEAIVEGIAVPGDLKPGLYTMKNVKLFSNGTLQVIGTEQTKFEAYGKEDEIRHMDEFSRRRNSQIERDMRHECVVEYGDRLSHRP